ncbi:hypothetical protein ACP4OV_012406 [Aristida adscensionis]
MEALASAPDLPVWPELGSSLQDQRGQGMGATMGMEEQMLPLDMPVKLSRPKPQFSGPPYTVETIFREFMGRRAALIRALTEAIRRCSFAGIESLGLYGDTDGNWELRPAAEQFVPGVLPEPTIGINNVRDKMERHEWLGDIAMYCDSWLVRMSFFIGGYYLEANERKKLFMMMNNVQTVHEKVNASYAYKCLGQQDKKAWEDFEVNDEIEDDDEDGQIFCAFCGDRYHKNEFWIYCNVCERWSHGKCVKTKAHEADKIRNYECPECITEKKGHDYKVDPLLQDLFKRY